MPFEAMAEKDLRHKAPTTTVVEYALADSTRTRHFEIVRQLFPDFQQVTKQDMLDLVLPYFDVGQTQDEAELFEVGVCSLYLTEKTVYAHHLVGDQVGMAAKMPFYDTRLAHFRARTPRSLRGAGELPNKYLLLKAFEDLIPPAVLNRPKAGFPSYYWHRGELATLHKHLFSDEVLRALPFLSPQALRKLVAQEKMSRRKSAGKLTWGMTVFVMWYLHFMLGWEVNEIVGKRRLDKRL